MLESISLFPPNEQTSYGNNFFNLWAITSRCTAYLSEFKYTSFINSIVHVYLHGSIILMLQYQMINYTYIGGTAFSYTILYKVFLKQTL